MVLFYDYKFSKIGIQQKEGIPFCLRFKRFPQSARKHATDNEWKGYDYKVC